MKLSRIKEVKEEIELAQLELENLRGRLKQISRPELEELLKRYSPLKSVVENLKTQIVDVERELENLRGELADSVVTLTQEILSRVKGRSAQKILILRYCAGKSFKEIEYELNCSKSNVFRLHQQGVKQFNLAEQ